MEIKQKIYYNNAKLHKTNKIKMLHKNNIKKDNLVY